MHIHSIRWDMGLPLQGSMPMCIPQCLLLQLLLRMGRWASRTSTTDNLPPKCSRLLLRRMHSLNGTQKAPIVVVEL